MITELLVTAVLSSTPTPFDRPVPEGWRIKGDRLECTYELSNFVESVTFVQQLVAPAEALGHHPDVSIAYNQVALSLTTHDEGGLTELDLQLAEDIDAIATQQTPPLRCQ